MDPSLIIAWIVRLSAHPELRGQLDVVGRGGVLVELQHVFARLHRRRRGSVYVPSGFAQRRRLEQQFTVLDCPALTVTRANATRRCGGVTLSLTGCFTYTGTMSVPSTEPVFLTLNRTDPQPLADTVVKR